MLVPSITTIEISEPQSTVALACVFPAEGSIDPTPGPVAGGDDKVANELPPQQLTSWDAGVHSEGSVNRVSEISSSDSNHSSQERSSKLVPPASAKSQAYEPGRSTSSGSSLQADLATDSPILVSRTAVLPSTAEVCGGVDMPSALVGGYKNVGVAKSSSYSEWQARFNSRLVSLKPFTIVLLLFLIKCATVNYSRVIYQLYALPYWFYWSAGRLFGNYIFSGKA